MTKIEWTEHTWNPVTGCTPVSAGCAHCYAATMTRRLAAMGQEEYIDLMGDKHFNGTVRCHEDALEIPLRRRKPTMYLVNSISDLFHEGIDDDFIDLVFAVMAVCPQHTFQVITKRPERMEAYFAERTLADAYTTLLATESTERAWTRGPLDEARAIIKTDDMIEIETELGESPLHPSPKTWPLPNVWLGTSVEDQATADERIPHLLRCPAAVRFLSCEPLLGTVDLTYCCKRSGGLYVEWLNALNGKMMHSSPGSSGQIANSETLPGIDWVIAGGESGPGARACRLEWIQSIVRQCRAAGVPCFVKQLGANPCVGLGEVQLSHRKGNDPSEWPESLRVREMPKGTK